MARLPIPGSDEGTWGEVLNDYLSQSLNADGTLKVASVSVDALQPESVNVSKIADGTITEAKLHTDVQDKLNVAASASTNLSASTSATTVTIASDTGTDASIPAATTTAAGVLSASDKTKLDGIDSGAQVNTVTSVAAMTGAVVLTASDVGLANVNNTSDANKPISTATQTALDGKTDAETTNDLTNRVTDTENGKMDINYRYWSGSSGVGSWSVRPSVPAGRHVDAYSTQDVLAPAPPDAVAGDMWYRHPEAV